MKSKAPLSLMEQLVMLLVFALAAALCLQVFVLAGRMSCRCAAEDRAVTEVQNVAEVLKAAGGDFRQCEVLLGGNGDEQLWQVWYDDNWKETSMEQAAYQLQITPVASDNPMLGSAEICCRTAQQDMLFRLRVSWQEVTDE